jgi:hypothetical protein
LAFFKHEPEKEKKLTKNERFIKEIIEEPFANERVEQFVQMDLCEQIITEEDREARCACGKGLGTKLVLESGNMCPACKKKRFGEKERIAGTKSVLKYWREELVKQKKNCKVLLK